MICDMPLVYSTLLTAADTAKDSIALYAMNNSTNLSYLANAAAEIMKQAVIPSEFERVIPAIGITALNYYIWEKKL